MQTFRGELSGAINVAHLHKLKRGNGVAVVIDKKLEGIARAIDLAA